MNTTITCRRCHEIKPLEAFPKVKSRKHGRDTLCRKCKNADDRKYAAWYRNTPHGKATNTWHKILQRCQNYDGKNPSYIHVECRMTQEAFVAWFVDAYNEWVNLHPNETASVDRIDPQGHYEIGNLQIISLVENIRRAHSATTAEQVAASVARICRKHQIPLSEVIALLKKKKTQDES